MMVGGEHAYSILQFDEQRGGGREIDRERERALRPSFSLGHGAAPQRRRHGSMAAVLGRVGCRAREGEGLRACAQSDRSMARRRLHGGCRQLLHSCTTAVHSGCRLLYTAATYSSHTAVDSCHTAAQLHCTAVSTAAVQCLQQLYGGCAMAVKSLYDGCKVGVRIVKWVHLG